MVSIKVIYTIDSPFFFSLLQASGLLNAPIHQSTLAHVLGALNRLPEEYYYLLKPYLLLKILIKKSKNKVYRNHEEYTNFGYFYVELPSIISSF